MDRDDRTLPERLTYDDLAREVRDVVAVLVSNHPDRDDVPHLVVQRLGDGSIWEASASRIPWEREARQWTRAQAASIVSWLDQHPRDPIWCVIAREKLEEWLVVADAEIVLGMRGL